MMTYKCKCGKEKKLTKATLEIKKGKVRCKQAKCKCGKYMQEVEKDFSGFPNIIRTEESLSKKKRHDRLWKGAKEKLIGERGVNEPFD